MDFALVLCVGLFVVYLAIWIINPDHARKINEVGWTQVNKTTQLAKDAAGGAEKATKRGAALWRLFKR